MTPPWLPPVLKSTIFFLCKEEIKKNRERKEVHAEEKENNRAKPRNECGRETERERERGRKKKKKKNIERNRAEKQAEALARQRE